MPGTKPVRQPTQLLTPSVAKQQIFQCKIERSRRTEIKVHPDTKTTLLSVYRTLCKHLAVPGPPNRRSLTKWQVLERRKYWSGDSEPLKDELQLKGGIASQRPVQRTPAIPFLRDLVMPCFFSFPLLMVVCHASLLAQLM